MLQQSTLAPAMSAWEHFNGPFNYDATPIGPAGCCVLIHNNPNTRMTYDFCGRNGYIIGPELNHYRCHTVVDATTKADIISEIVEYRHSETRTGGVTPLGTGRDWARGLCRRGGGEWFNKWRRKYVTKKVEPTGIDRGASKIEGSERGDTGRGKRH